MIEVIGLNKQFSDNVVYRDYNKVFSSQKVCIDAPNGQGKTTLLMMLAGLEKPQSGTFLFAGKTAKELGKEVALATDRIALPEFLTARQIIHLSVSTLGCQWPEAVISGFNFSEFLNTRFDALSSGNQKKCQLILALMRKAPYLLLDEPSAALDQTSIQYLLYLLDFYLADKPNGQIIITCHEPAPFVEQGFECISL
ncbi:aliphatic sulfonates import ATP-binding protein SsuB 3 [Pseudoalteromonas sp. BSi20652]|uniref:ATP-binding cassette domain-containing protein n=1 Tax=Pseudoalteromonas sp. BSi20652 TaxID=388384 RepID=UPI000231A14E|nr:ATP-binding cassette domain-containing protein [Pseudoalteromonas sp. BSi20652]GAA61951.1 aliphatic sulfonates import ATP-binding protein SsuB 3 [Pseudoalteromonas sp. BSi20652]